MAVAFDTNGTSGQVTGSPATVTANITIGANTNRVLFACIYGDAGTIVTAVTWNTTETMTLVDSVNVIGVGFAAVYQLINPTAGAHSCIAAVTTTTESGVSALSYSGVDQSTPVNIFGHTNGSSGTATHSITTTIDSCWLAGFCNAQRTITPSTGIATVRDAIFAQVKSSDNNASSGTAGSKSGSMTLATSNVWEIILWAIQPSVSTTLRLLSSTGVGA